MAILLFFCILSSVLLIEIATEALLREKYTDTFWVHFVLTIIVSILWSIFYWLI